MTRSITVFVTFCALVGAALSGEVTNAAQADETASPQLRVGTFDSRAVAFAYARSEMFKKWLNELATAASEAEAAGDTARVKELEEQAQAEHALRSKQVFSTFPAYDVLAKIEEEIPKIAVEAGVDVIVSKWDVVYKRSGIEFVDVTELMVGVFRLDEDSRKMLKDLQQKAPVPLGEFGEHE